MTQFEFDAKAGNRALRKLGGSIGRGGGRGGRGTLGGMNERFDPNAFDGDGDGFVQDGSPFERPATPSAPKLPTTTPTTTDDAGDTGSPSAPKRRSLFSRSTPKPRKRVGDKPIGHPKWLHGRTPEEIARLVVPSSMEEARDAYILFAAGQRSAYESDEAYQAAVELAQGQFLLAETVDKLAKEKVAAGIELDDNEVYMDVDFSPEAVTRARELVQKSLEESPLHYWVVQNFGHPQVVLNKYGNQKSDNWMFYSTHQNIIVMTPEALDNAGENGFAEFYTLNGIYGRSHADPTNGGSLRHEYGHYLDNLMKRRYNAQKVREVAGLKRHDPMFDDNDDNPMSADDMFTFLAYAQQEVPRWSRSARNDAKEGQYIWVDSQYGHSNPEEMFAEAYSAIARPNQDSITELANDFAYAYFAELLGLERKRRNNRKTDPRAYNSLFVDAPQERLPNGLALQRKPRPNQNIMPTTNGVDIGDRLHDLPNPTSIYDGRGRERLLTVGDHRFYDRATPSPQLIGDKTLDGRAQLGAYRFVTDDTHSDMTRALSAVTLGFPLDDFPLHGNENPRDIEMLRGVLTGNVAQLPKDSRDRVERAMQDAINISVGIQRAEPTTENLYRAVPMTQAQFEQALAVDDEFPLPITAFTSKPNMDYSVNLTLRAGARALETDDDNWLTQGTFRVANVDERDGTLFYALEHTETYDPRHDAMRPVADGSDDPRTWRARGLASRRYTDDEATAMDRDRGRRLESIVPAEKEPLKNILRRLFYPSTEADKEEARSIIERTQLLVQERINKRLSRVAEVIYGIYGDEKPWKEGVEAFRKYDAMREEIDSVLSKLAKTNKEAYLADSAKQPRLVPDPDNPGRMIPGRGSKIAPEPRITAEMIDAILDRIDRGELEPRVFDREPGAVGGSLYVDLAELSKEDIDALRVMRDAMFEMQDMYLNEKSVMLDGEEYTFATRANTIVRDGTSGYGMSGRALYMSGEIFDAQGRKVTESWGRTLRFDTGSISLLNDTLFIAEAYKSKGIAALINNHAFLWGKEHGNMSVTLHTASSGPFVWVRSGFPVREGSTHNAVVDGLLPRLKAQVKKYQDGLPSIIENDDEALRVAAWIQIAEDRPHKASLVTLYNSFDIDDRERGNDLAVYLADALDPASGELVLDLGEAPTDHLPYQTIIDDPTNFIRAWRNSKDGTVDTPVQRQRHALDIRGNTINEPIDEKTTSLLANIANEIDSSPVQRDRSPVNHIDRELPFLLEATGYNLPPQLATEEEFVALISQNSNGFPTHRVGHVVPIGTKPEEAMNAARATLFSDTPPFAGRAGMQVDTRAESGIAFISGEVTKSYDPDKIPSVLAAIPPSARLAKRNELRDARIFLQNLDLEQFKKAIGYKRPLDRDDLRVRNMRIRREIPELFSDETRNDIAMALSRALSINDQIGEDPEADSNLIKARDLILNANEGTLAVLLGYDGYEDTLVGRITMLNRRGVVAMDTVKNPVEAAKLVATVKDENDRPMHNQFLRNPSDMDSKTPWYEQGMPLFALRNTPYNREREAERSVGTHWRRRIHARPSRNGIV